MIGQDVKGDREGDQVTGHEEDNEEQLGDTKEFSTKAAHEDLSSVRHTGDEWVSQLKLPHEVAGICRDNTDSDEDNQRSVPISFPRSPVSLACGKTNGTKPSVATAAGRDKTPSEMVSATITA